MSVHAFIEQLGSAERAAYELGLSEGYMIGLFEGEGSMGFAQSPHGRKFFYPRVQLTTTDRDVLERFVAQAGIGRVGGPYGGDPPRKPAYSWSVSGHAAATFIRRVAPYLGHRRRHRANQVISSEDQLALLLPEGAEV